MPSFLPEGPLSLKEHLSPKAQTLLKIAGYSDEETITEANFRAALAADACGAQVFAQGMKMFLTVRFGCVWRGDIWVVDIFLFVLFFSQTIRHAYKLTTTTKTHMQDLRSLEKVFFDYLSYIEKSQK